jgi:hypothetical protein
MFYYLLNRKIDPNHKEEFLKVKDEISLFQMIQILKWHRLAKFVAASTGIYLVLVLLNSIHLIFEEVKRCQKEGLLPITPSSQREQVKTEVNQPSFFDAIYLGRIRRQTAKSGHSIRTVLFAIILAIFPFLGIERLCFLQSTHFLKVLILEAFVKVRIFWSRLTKKIEGSFSKSNSSLTEQEVSKLSLDLKAIAFECTSMYLIGCLFFAFLSLSITPFSMESKVQKVLYYANVVFSLLIFIFIPLFRYVLALHNYAWYKTIPEMILLFLIIFMIGSSLKPLTVLILEIWLGFNIYTCFIHTYSEKKLVQPVY